MPASGEPGDKTWGSVPYEERVQLGPWMAASYDPEMNLVHVGTSGHVADTQFVLGGIENRYLIPQLDAVPRQRPRRDSV